jgi:hypothetical protein
MAPPPRRGAAAVEPETIEAVPEAHPGSKTRRLLYKLIMAGLLVAFLGVGGAVGFVAWTKVQSTESALAQEAKTAYDEGRFPEAVSKYHQLVQKFPNSQRIDEYQFFRDLADVRAQLGSAVAAPDATLDKVNEFLNGNGQNPLLKEHAREFGPDFLQWLVARYQAGADKPDLPTGFVKKAQATLQLAQQLVPEAFTREDLAKVEEAFHKVEVAVAKQERRKAVIAQLEKLKPSAEGIKEAHRLIAQETREEAGFDQDPAVQAALGKLMDGQLQEVRYVEAGEAPRRHGRAEDLEPSMVVNQLLYGIPPQRRDNDPVVLALVRGVLYALAQSNGEIVWAMRVGIDTATLPVRVPAAGGRPEIVLALSADTETLTALNAANGDQLWKYHLSAPCLGQPVVVGPRAYVPTYDGWVHEVELARGQPIGHYELGQHLTLGGTRQERTNLVYFPADDQCVYVLDVDRRRCERILYSGHPSGSLRSAPIVVNPGGGDEGYLILAQTAGLDATQLRAFSLPINNGQAPPAVQTRPTPGWPWFSPYHDPEKLVLVTDAGAVGLFGILQERNQDSALFPLVHGDFRMAPGPAADPAHPGRAQVVACQDDALWVLAHGGLQKLNLTLNPRTGLQLSVDPLWTEPLPLGSPLHASQVEPHGASTTLFLVTQAPNRRGCLATAVDAGSRKMLWQRELGLVCQEAPVALGPQNVLAVDQGGGVFAFDPTRRRNDLWQPGGLSLAKPLPDNPSFPPVLVAAGDGATAYEIACPGKGTQLVVRRFQVEAASGRVVPPQDMDEKLVDLPAPPAGAAAVRGASLLLPLDDGTLFRVQLPDCPPGTPGPEWRPARAAGHRCHVVWINDEDFLATDGGRAVNHFRWPLGKTWTALPLDKEAKDPTVALRRSIVTPPALLPDASGELAACVGDASGTLTLLRGERLEEVQRWDLGGRITAGPFVRGNRVGCVVDGSRLAWIDPGRKEPLWEYKSRTAGPIVGEPQLVEDMLVVAHQSGRFVGLDPGTGKAHGPGFALQASAAPATSPAPFGAGRAFAPLTDGTVLLLDLRHLRGPVVEFPIVW